MTALLCFARARACVCVYVCVCVGWWVRACMAILTRELGSVCVHARSHLKAASVCTDHKHHGLDVGGHLHGAAHSHYAALSEFPLTRLAATSPPPHRGLLLGPGRGGTARGGSCGGTACAAPWCSSRPYPSLGALGGGEAVGGPRVPARPPPGRPARGRWSAGRGHGSPSAGPAQPYSFTWGRGTGPRPPGGGPASLRRAQR